MIKGGRLLKVCRDILVGFIDNNLLSDPTPILK